MAKEHQAKRRSTHRYRIYRKDHDSRWIHLLHTSLNKSALVYSKISLLRTSSWTPCQYSSHGKNPERRERAADQRVEIFCAMFTIKQTRKIAVSFLALSDQTTHRKDRNKERKVRLFMDGDNRQDQSNKHSSSDGGCSLIARISCYFLTRLLQSERERKAKDFNLSEVGWDDENKANTVLNKFSNMKMESNHSYPPGQRSHKAARRRM